ncbi:MAG: hypothetical protein V2I76_00865 [Roseobacter sp.]|jgi:hypothetical protein|nr:hypothetical protein [Roseobacter sp.]
MKILTLAATASAVFLMPMAAQTAPVTVLSMAVSGTVSGIDFNAARIETDSGETGFPSDPSLSLSYYGLSGGLFTADIGQTVSGTITLFEDSETSALSLSCALAQYSYDMCAGAALAWATTEDDGDLVLGAGDGGYYTQIITNGDAASMIYADDNQYFGETPDGRYWYSYGLTLTWDLTVEPSAQETSLVVAPLPSSALLLLTPFAYVAFRRRRELRRI